MMHEDYRTALAKITLAPLTLTETDFAVLQEFNPADELRARQVVRTKQLELVQTKAIDAPRRETQVSTAALVFEVVKVLSHIKARLDELERRDATQTSSIADLRKNLDQLHALVQDTSHTLIS